MKYLFQFAEAFNTLYYEVYGDAYQQQRDHNKYDVQQDSLLLLCFFFFLHVGVLILSLVFKFLPSPGNRVTLNQGKNLSRKPC